jgi:REP element-mobilizing transposase RayT
MGEHIFKRHNKTLLLYHLVFPLKYRKSVIPDEIGGA